MKSILTAAFGPSYITTLCGLLSRIALVCGAIAAAPGQLSFLPEAWRIKALGGCGLVWFIFGVLKDFNTADAAPSTGSGLSAPAAGPAQPSRFGNALPAIAMLLALSALAGCASLSSVATQVQTALASPLATQIESEVGPLISAYVTAGNYNEASAVNLGLQSISALAPTVAQQAGIPALQSLIQTTVSTYTGDTSATGMQLASNIATNVIKALGSNPTAAQIQAALIQAGTTAANTAG